MAHSQEIGHKNAYNKMFKYDNPLCMGPIQLSPISIKFLFMSQLHKYDTVHSDSHHHLIAAESIPISVFECLIRFIFSPPIPALLWVHSVMVIFVSSEGVSVSFVVEWCEKRRGGCHGFGCIVGRCTGNMWVNGYIYREIISCG